MPSPKRILLVGNFLSHLGGARAPIEDLAQQLRDSGFELTTVSTISNRFLRAANMLSAAVWHSRRSDAAVVDLYSGPAFYWGAAVTWLLSRLGCPVVVALHGGGLPEFAAEHPGPVTRCLARAAAVIAPSTFLAEGMAPYRAGIRLLPNPLPVKGFPFVPRTAARPRLVWVRGFHAIYSPLDAVRVLAHLKTEFPAIRLTMVGGPRGDDSLEQSRRLASDLGVEAEIGFTGSLDRSLVAAQLGAHDIFLNTSLVDNTPVSIMEAMACGLCVVSTNVGGVPHLVNDGEDALLTPPADPGAMAEAVRRILHDPALALRLSEAGRRKAESFDWPRILPQWLNVLDAVMTAKGSRVAPAWNS